MFIGLGYIGVPTAIIANKHGIKLIGVNTYPKVTERQAKENCTSLNQIWRRC